MIPETNDSLNLLIQSAKEPLIDKLEKALEINRELVEACDKLADKIRPGRSVDPTRTWFWDYELSEWIEALQKAKGDSR